MFKRAAILMLAVVAVLPTAARADAEVLLSVDDGDFFYDVDGDCVGDSDAAADGVATRHWHVGIPLAPAAVEAAAGFGCLGGPKTWTVTIDDGKTGTIAGSIRYTWDQDVPGGCCNDVQLHVSLPDGTISHSTVLTEGPKPVIPTVIPIQSHTFTFVIPAGTYTIAEDIFSGEHTAWLTKMTVSQTAGGPTY